MDVFQAGFALVVLFLRKHPGIAALLYQGLVELRQVGLLCQALHSADQVHKLLELGGCLLQLRNLPGVGNDIPKAPPHLGGDAPGSLHGLGANATGGIVHHPEQAQVIIGVVDDAEIGQHVLDLRPLEEAEAPHHPVGDAVALQGHLNLVGQGVHPVEDGAVPPLFPLAIGFQQLGGHIHPLLPLVAGGVEMDFLPLPMLGPEVFALPAPVVADHRIGRLQDVSGGAVVLLQPDHPGIFILTFEGEDVLNGGPPEAVDGLVIVPHHADVLPAPCQQRRQEVLEVVGVLVLVDEDVAELPLVILPHLRELLQQTDGVEDDVVKI